MPGQGVRGAGAADVINESLVLVLSFKLQTEWALKHHLSRCKDLLTLNWPALYAGQVKCYISNISLCEMFKKPQFVSL